MFIPPEKVQLSSELVSQEIAIHSAFGILLCSKVLASIPFICHAFLYLCSACSGELFSMFLKGKKISPIGHLAKRNGLLNTQ